LIAATEAPLGRLDLILGDGTDDGADRVCLHIRGWRIVERTHRRHRTESCGHAPADGNRQWSGHENDTES
jgi:hypothetical protein